MNIPIYRAWCEKDSEYAVGFFISDDKENEILTRLDSGEMYARGIDTTTLAIHFPDMLDSQGNKIFASLSEDGKGGDCTFMENDYNETFCWDRLNACVVLKSRNYEGRCFRNGSRNETVFNTYKIIGIQK